MKRSLAALLWLSATMAMASGPAVIEWRDVALVLSNAPDVKPTVLPLATPPVPLEASIERVVVEPAVLKVAVGGRFCISQFDLGAYATGGVRTPGVPATLAMQQVQLRGLTLESGPKDLCFTVRRAGEYSLRFSSRLAASDATFRGAQAFVRTN